MALAGDAKGVTHSARIARRRGRTRSVNLSVNLAPMIDMTFLLLIFFLVTSTFERAEGLLASSMPELGEVAGVPLPLSPIVIRLARTGPEHEDFSIRLDQLRKSPNNLEELVAALKGIQEQPGFDEQTPVILIADDDLPWDHVVGCWNAAIRAGCKRVAFGEP